MFKIHFIEVKLLAVLNRSLLASFKQYLEQETGISFEPVDSTQLVARGPLTIGNGHSLDPRQYLIDLMAKARMRFPRVSIEQMRISYYETDDQIQIVAVSGS